MNSRIFFGITKAQFNELLTYCDPIPEGDHRRFIYKKDLLLFLCKLHHGVADDFLKIMFSYSSRQAVSMAFKVTHSKIYPHSHWI